MKSDNEAQDRVVRMADGILAIVAGVDIAEADIALTLAVMATICATGSDAARRRQMAEGFTRQVREFIQREDIVEWIKASVRPVSFSEPPTMKRPGNELVREAVATVVARGFTPTVRNGGKHFKLSWVANGRRRVLVISQSPSNQKARVQSRAVLRRLLSM